MSNGDKSPIMRQHGRTLFQVFAVSLRVQVVDPQRQWHNIPARERADVLSVRIDEALNLPLGTIALARLFPFVKQSFRSAWRTVFQECVPLSLTSQQNVAVILSKFNAVFG